ncbi:hypothetical protein D3C81_1902990 [compost metagenome]
MDSNLNATAARNGIVISVISVSCQLIVNIIMEPNSTIKNTFSSWANPKPINSRMASRSPVSRDIRSPVFAVS